MTDTNHSFVTNTMSQDNTTQPPRFRVALLYTVFFLSGVAGLGYQMAWSRMFTVGLGHEMPSVLAVVAAFFGGLALGSWLLDGPVSRSERPGRWYVWLEVLIGAWGFASIFLIGWFNELAQQLIGVDPSPARHWAVAFGVPLVALLPATTAMGATLPAMDRFVSPLVPGGRCIGGLYASNTAGAVVGTLGSAFVIMPIAGFHTTVALLASVNLLCGLAVLFMRQPCRDQETQPPLAAVSHTPPWRIGVTVFFTGLLGIGYEALGVRVMSQVLENTVYSFAAVLSVYLLGTAIGAALYQWLGKRVGFESLLGYLLWGLSTACMVGTLLLRFAQPVYARARKDYFGDSLYGVMGGEMVVAVMVFFLPTVLMGGTFSHLVQAARREGGGVGRAAAVNTLGAAFAPLIFGVLLLPWLGAKWSLVIVSLGYLPLIPTKARAPWMLQAVPVLLVLALPANLQVVTKYPEDKLIDYREGVMAAVAVVRERDGHLSLRVNNRFQMGNTRGVLDESLQAHIPLLLHPDPQNALFLGLGSGITFYTAAYHPGVEAHGVELVPEVVEAMQYFQPNNLPADSVRRLKIMTADARRYVRATTKRYDVIVADLFHPGRDGAGFLYTREHFEAVRACMAPGGLICQWLPLYQLDEPTLKMIIRTFLEVFPHTRAYIVDFKIIHPMLGLVATQDPFDYPPDWFERRVRDDTLRRVLKGVLVHNGFRFFGSYLAGTQQLGDFAGQGPVNTDDHPLVMYTAPRFTSRMDATVYGRLGVMLDQCETKIDGLIASSDSAETQDFVARLDRYTEARDVFIRGFFAAAAGDEQLAVDRFIQSAALSEDFVVGYAHCLEIAQRQAQANPEFSRMVLRRLAEACPDRPEARQQLQQLFGE